MLLGSFALKAQTKFSLSEAVKYGLENHQSLKNADIDILSADVRIKEIKSAGLPQVNANLQLLGNPILQKVFLPARFLDPTAPDDAPSIAAPFGVNFSNNLSASVNQLVFDGTYLLGLKAADLYRELAQKNATASKITVKENIMKAYYSALVAEERIKILELNINRLDSLFADTKILNEKGFVEKIDADRLEVQVNNLKTERQKIKNLIELSYALLKFQMGMNINEAIALTDRINENDLAFIEQKTVQDFNYSSRIEVSTLESSKKLAAMDIENNKRGYWPKVFAFGNLGFNQGSNTFNPFQKWFSFSTVGLQVAAPIWDSNLKKNKIQQAVLTVQKLENTIKLVESSIDLQIKQANIILTNNAESLKIQKRNLEIAKEVVRVSKEKYKAGVGSNIEVINAESSLKESQTNYFAALYDAMLAKVDLDKALGKLN